MKKALTVLLLLLIIFVSFSYIVLRISAQGSEDNFFNRNWREKFASHPIARKILGLHFDGDGKADYLSGRYSKIVIEVDWMKDHEIPYSALVLLKEKIEAITGKDVQILESDAIPYVENLEPKDVDDIVKKYRNVNFIKNSANLYLLYGSTYEGALDHLGSTYEEYGLMLFESALRNFTNENSDTLINYIASTALHEFGHQIGLPHNDIENCLLNEHAEQSHVARENPEDVVIDFCEYEKELIQELK
jgi:predicted Zn-dependent protease with MMP-like domain